MSARHGTSEKRGPAECRVSVFCGVSVDGFIAREDGGLDWLTSRGEKAGDYGYDAFMARIDALVMGRNTFDVVLGFGKWFYGKKPLIVLTHRPPPSNAKVPSTVEFQSGTPKEIVERLAQRGLTRLYVDGGTTIQDFLAAGLVDELIISQVPVLIGSGIRLFGPLPHDVPLRHKGTKTFPGGMIQTTYEVEHRAEGIRSPAAGKAKRR